MGKFGWFEPNSGQRAALDQSNAGQPIVRAFPFTFDTPDILTGAEVGWTPVTGDWLMDAWVEVITAWDGTTPVVDFGMFLDGDVAGVFGYESGPVDLTVADRSDAYFMPSGLSTSGGGTPAYGLFQSMLAATSMERSVPAKFVAAAPIKIVVSQNGHADGADPASTQGSAVLYLVTVTPA